MGAKLCKAGKGGKRGRRRHRRLIRPTELQLNSKLGTTTKRREEGRRGEGGEREKKEEEGEIFTFSSTPSSFRSSSRERERERRSNNERDGDREKFQARGPHIFRKRARTCSSQGICGPTHLSRKKRPKIYGGHVRPWGREAKRDVGMHSFRQGGKK